MVKLFPANTRTEFVDLVCAGVAVSRAAQRVGADGGTGSRWWAQSGQMKISMGFTGGLSDPAPTPEGPGGRALTSEERGMIQMGRRSGMSYSDIGAAIGRNKSVVWREVNRNTSRDGVYYASVAQATAHQARRRPKPLKLVESEVLCEQIAAWMDDGWSPKLISSMLAVTFPDDQTMQVSHETIYQALYVQARGNLRADLAEFGFEEVRWYDLIRWKMADDFTKTLHGMDITKAANGQLTYTRTDLPVRFWKTTWSPKWYLSAFPSNEINKAYGLVQNPGW